MPAIVVIALCVIALFSLVAYAGKGPCQNVISGVFNNTIYCSFGVCFGNVAIIPDQYSCAEIT